MNMIELNGYDWTKDEFAMYSAKSVIYRQCERDDSLRALLFLNIYYDDV